MAALIRVTACTGNAHKLDEFRDLFPDWELDLLADAEFPEEDGETYYDNALIKARYGRIVGPPDRFMLADDSGVEVAALGGGPGVVTARWAEGRHVEKLLEALDGVADRRAQYVCELVLLSPEREVFRGTGVLPGTVALAPAGGEGFGFDPIFVPDGESVSVAALGDAWKAVHSHRALAAQALLSVV